MTTHTPGDTGRHMRLVPDGVPAVYPTTDAVILQADPDDAQTLSRILAHYEVLTTGETRCEGYNPDVWHHVLVELLTAKARVEMQMVPFVLASPEVPR